MIRNRTDIKSIKAIDSLMAQYGEPDVIYSDKESLMMHNVNVEKEKNFRVNCFRNLK